MYKIVPLIFLFMLSYALLYAEPAKKAKTPPAQTTKKAPPKKEPERTLIIEEKEKTAEELLEKLDTTYKTLVNFQALYRQKVHKPKIKENSEDKLSLKSNGKIYVQRPSWLCQKCWRIIWDIETPVEYRLLTNRKTMWLYNSISQTVKIQKFTDLNPGSQFIMNLLLGRHNLVKEFHAKKSLEHPWGIELTPKGKSDLSVIRIEIDPVNFWAKSLSLETKDKTLYEFELSGALKNLPEIPEMEVFNKQNNFIVPEGVTPIY